ncbi:hypothetical protein PABG_11234 [Paracoccidioides brasiliensis Pb03]|nr:hypothetical protein PABG_11234 [Paracoccidioides brasiliensis Pb03]
MNPGTQWIFSRQIRNPKWIQTNPQENPPQPNYEGQFTHNNPPRLGQVTQGVAIGQQAPNQPQHQHPLVYQPPFDPFYVKFAPMRRPEFPDADEEPLQHSFHAQWPQTIAQRLQDGMQPQPPNPPTVLPRPNSSIKHPFGICRIGQRQTLTMCQIHYEITHTTKQNELYLSRFPRPVLAPILP